MNTIGFVLLALVWGSSPGATAHPGASTVLVADSLEQLKSDIDDAQKKGAPPITEAQAVEFGTRACNLAKQATDSAGRVEALTLSHGMRFRGKSAALDKQRGEIWDLLTEKDAEDPALARLVSVYLTDSDRAAALGKRSNLPETRAACAFVPLGVAIRRSDRSETETKTLIDGLRAFQKEFGQVNDTLRKQPWSEVCESHLFQLEHLSIGAVAPDIEGTDTAGVNFKLSDYRGKVVMLDFWGNW